MVKDFIRPILDIFGKSPFGPIYEHALKGKETVYALKKVVDAWCKGDMESVVKLAEEVSKLEHEADIIKQKVRERLHAAVLLPVDRNDALEFLKPQDSIADSAERAAELISIKEDVILTETLKKQFREMMNKTIECIDIYDALVSEIKDLLDSSFSKKVVMRTVEIVPKIEELEHEVDIIELEMLKEIYKSEKELGATNVFHLYHIIITLADVSDNTARAADRLRTMIYRPM
jgi:hypothetical protein